MHELTVGQKVICKHKNGRYYQCDVVQLSKDTFYEVNFDDGSFSDNLFPEDIVVQIIFFFTLFHLKQNRKLLCFSRRAETLFIPQCNRLLLQLFALQQCSAFYLFVIGN